MYLSGCIPAIVTPFIKGQLDVSALEQYLTYLSHYNLSGIVIGGSTGEGYLLHEAERITIIEYARSILKNMPIFVGIAAFSTENAVLQAKMAAKYGASGVMMTPPPYIGASAGLDNYFISVADILPLIVYNNPARTNVDLNNEMIIRLSKHSNIIALKESAYQNSRIAQLRSQVSDDFSLIAGNDDMLVPMSLLGCNGVISVLANLFPKLFIDTWNMIKNKQMDNLIKNNLLISRMQYVFANTATNPVPLKYALSKLGLMSDEVRHPLVTLTDDRKKAIDYLLNDIAPLTNINVSGFYNI